MMEINFVTRFKEDYIFLDIVGLSGDTREFFV